MSNHETPASDFDEVVAGPKADSQNIDDVYGPSTVIAAIEQIEELVEEARALPMSASVLVNKAEMLDLLAQARQALPDDLLAADAVVADADAVMVRADDAAQTTLDEANARAKTIVEDARSKAEELTQRAQEDAQQEVARAQQEAAATVEQAHEEARRVEQQARERAEELVSEQPIVEQARERGEEIVNKARKHALELANGADSYCQESLTALTKTLEKMYSQAQAGREKIESHRRADHE
ncbi:hypothetical protein QS713_08640 [Gleimia hominis]|uniref:Cell division initiation protein n=1 Tax=Gleimia hominis TaxID=595468 RepID=A0ABU3ICL0_9ACTO|nr:hypothetical protein [Gleimia hominis]MDT3768124.1 hypothetical protein [Gleimia hominis]